MIRSGILTKYRRKLPNSEKVFGSEVGLSRRNAIKKLSRKILETPSEELRSFADCAQESRNPSVVSRSGIHKVAVRVAGIVPGIIDSKLRHSIVGQ